MTTNAEARRRKAQSARDKARNQRDADRRFDRIFVKAWGSFRPAQSPLPASRTQTEEQASPSRTMKPKPDFLSTCFNNAKHSDAIVYIQGVKLYAHKLVICGKCEYFASAFDERFKEGEQGFIELSEGSAVAHYRVIEFLYTGDYSDDVQAEGLEDDPDLLKDTRVYALAEMFLLEDLKVLAHAKFQARLPKGWMPTIPPSLLECVREIYDTTPDSGLLRPEVVRFFLTHRDAIKKDEGFLRLIGEGGDFAVDLIRSM